MIGTTQKNANNTLPIKVLKYTYYHTKCSQYDLKRSTNAEGRLCMQRIDTAEPLFFIACLVSFFFFCGKASFLNLLIVLNSLFFPSKTTMKYATSFDSLYYYDYDSLY